MPPQLIRPAVLDGLSDADDGGNGGGSDGDGSGARAAAKATATTASDEVSAKAADPPQLDPPPIQFTFLSQFSSSLSTVA